MSETAIFLNCPLYKTLQRTIPSKVRPSSSGHDVRGWNASCELRARTALDGQVELRERQAAAHHRLDAHAAHLR